jgi:hypothetical protein
MCETMRPAPDPELFDEDGGGALVFAAVVLSAFALACGLGASAALGEPAAAPAAAGAVFALADTAAAAAATLAAVADCDPALDDAAALFDAAASEAAGSVFTSVALTSMVA